MIFVVGCGRSGTSWLFNWLLQHPKVCGVWGETYLFSRLDSIVRPTACDNRNISLGYPSHLSSQGIHKWINTKSFDKITSKYVISLIEELTINLQTDKPDANCFAEKTPDHLWHMETIDECLQDVCEVYFVHIYRDGRNVVESFNRQQWVTIQDATLRWISAAKKVLDKTNKTNNTLNVRYEQLIEQPETSVDILDFCGLSHCPSISSFTSKCDDNSQQTYRPNLWKSITDRELLTSFKTMEPYLKELGYEI